MTATRELIELQSVDVEIGRRRARLAEISPLIGDDSTVRGLARQSALLESRLRGALSRQKTLDEAVADYTVKVDTAETRLYGGAVRSPRELQDLQADVNMLKRHRAEQEDALLVVLDEVDDARRGRDSAAQLLESATAGWEAEQQSMGEEFERLERETAELGLRREGVISRIPRSEVALYDRARRRHPMHPVARLHSGVCDACRVGVPTRMALEIRAGDVLTLCPNCDRILLPE